MFLSNISAGKEGAKTFAFRIAGVSFDLDDWIVAKTQMAFKLNTNNAERINKWIGEIEKVKELEWDTEMVAAG